MDELSREERTAALRANDACHELADLCDEIATFAPDLDPKDFLTTLGALVAGIDPGLKGVLSLARGGRNEIIGAGFKPEFDDGTAGQARHFAGTAASAVRFGATPTELLAHNVLDPPDTADGRLTSAAVQFVRALLDGSLEIAHAGDWVRRTLCLAEQPERPPAVPDAPTAFDVLTRDHPEATAIRERFTADEWSFLVELPEGVVIAASVAEPDAGDEQVREIVAGIQRIEAPPPAGQTPLVGAVLASRTTRLEMLAQIPDPSAAAGVVDRVLADVRRAMKLLASRDIDEADQRGYRALLQSAATSAAEAVAHGGFLGIGGEAVTPREEAFLNRLNRLLDLEDTP